MHATAGAPDLREKILTAALQVLKTEGIGKFSQTAVAEQAGIRQSHLTYYFPTRADLLEATAEQMLEGVAQRILTAGREVPGWGPSHLVGRLGQTMTAHPHMRMFLAMVVAGDQDPVVKRLIKRGTERVRAAIAEALGGAPGDDRRARVIQVAIWGLGLYQFANQLPPDQDPRNDVLNLLEEYI